MEKKNYLYVLAFLCVLGGGLWLYSGRDDCSKRELTERLKKIARKIPFVWNDEHMYRINDKKDEAIHKWHKKCGDSKENLYFSETEERKIIEEPLDEQMKKVKKFDFMLDFVQGYPDLRTIAKEKYLSVKEKLSELRGMKKRIMGEYKKSGPFHADPAQFFQKSIIGFIDYQISKLEKKGG